jgi:aerobic-type carbon monoxide dehydrogenase small subunit (CoxS/CutS family)
MSIVRTLVRAGTPRVATMPEDGDLLQAVRAFLGVRSASRGCADGSCGACRVLLDGALVKSCRVKIADVREGAVVEAYEDVRKDAAAKRAVAAFDTERPTRCSLCVGSVGVTAAWLARTGRAGRPAAVEDVVEDANCVCTGKGSLRRALLAK